MDRSRAILTRGEKSGHEYINIDWSGQTLTAADKRWQHCVDEMVNDWPVINVAVSTMSWP